MVRSFQIRTPPAHAGLFTTCLRPDPAGVRGL